MSSKTVLSFVAWQHLLGVISYYVSGTLTVSQIMLFKA